MAPEKQMQHISRGSPGSADHFCPAWVRLSNIQPLPFCQSRARWIWFLEEGPHRAWILKKVEMASPALVLEQEQNCWRSRRVQRIFFLFMMNSTDIFSSICFTSLPTQVKRPIACTQRPSFSSFLFYGSSFIYLPWFYITSWIEKTKVFFTSCENKKWVLPYCPENKALQLCYSIHNSLQENSPHPGGMCDTPTHQQPDRDQFSCQLLVLWDVVYWQKLSPQEEKDQFHHRM